MMRATLSYRSTAAFFPQAMTMIDRRSSFQDEPLVNRHVSTAQSSCCCVSFHIIAICMFELSTRADVRITKMAELIDFYLFIRLFVCFLCWIILFFFFKGFFFFCNLLADLTAIPGINKCISGHRIKYWLHVFTRKSFENWFMWKTTHLNVENFENEQKSHWKRSITNIRTRKYTFSSMKLRKVN